MMLLLLLGIGGVGAGVAAMGGSRTGTAARVGAIAGVLALLIVLALALALDAPRFDASGVQADAGLFGGRLIPTDYLRLVVALWAMDAGLVVGIAWLLGGLAALRGLLSGTLAAIVAGTVALGATDPAVGVAAAAGAGLAALLVVLAADRGSAIAAGARELRVTLAGGALLLGALAVTPVAAALALAVKPEGAEPTIVAGPGAGEAGAVIGLAALGIILGVAVRLGAIPFHLRVPRLTDATPPIATSLLLAWLPLPMAVVGLAVLDRQVAPLALSLEGERAVVIVLAALTLLGAALAAFVHEDLRHSVGYLVVADGGLVLLGLAALDPAAWGPTRVWLVALAASKTALAAWAAVAEMRFGTRSLPDLRGWVRRAPILAAALGLTIVATYGLPGWIVFTARGDLAGLAAGSPWNALLILAGFLTLPAYLRMLAIGVGPATSRVSGAAPERISRLRRPAETLPVQVEGAEILAAPVQPDQPAQPAQPADQGRPAEQARRRLAGSSGATGSLGRRLATALRRDRTELTSAAVLALAVLAALTSWGALDIGGAASEPAPIVAQSSAD